MKPEKPTSEEIEVLNQGCRSGALRIINIILLAVLMRTCIDFFEADTAAMMIEIASGLGLLFVSELIICIFYPPKNLEL